MSKLQRNSNFLSIPVIVSRGIVVFPDSDVHLDIAREFTHAAVKVAKETNDNITVILNQKDVYVEYPTNEDLYDIGTIVKIKQYTKNKNDAGILVAGIDRAKCFNIRYNGTYYVADVEIIDDNVETEITPEVEAATHQLFALYDEFSHLVPRSSNDVDKKIKNASNVGQICDIIADSYLVNQIDRQSVLAEIDHIQRIIELCKILSHEIEVFKLEIDISNKVKRQLDKSQRDYYLREQLKVIQSELDDDYAAGDDEETTEYISKLNTIAFTDEIKEKLKKEIFRLEKLPFSSAEYSLLKAYIDTCLELPYGIKTEDSIDVRKAEKILNDEHYGLEKVKNRILEFIAAKSYSPKYKGQILCFVGPPGVGKTSIVSSIAKALNKKMVRISLGGIHDEADIRGHRKTYIGAMPGRIITALNNAKVMNPLILFDEIDKLGTGGYHGDPASALLEVLDVEQNKKFRDHFIEFDVDLSDCMFICTANTSSTIPRPLLDRMEIIQIDSYTENEKLHIAKKHLLSKQMELHSIDKKSLSVTDKAIKKLIELYTREAGVRNLEREIAKICRKTVSEFVNDKTINISITDKNLEEYAGKPKFVAEKNPSTDEIGLVNGLAWTEIGGELLQVEAAIMDGTGKIELTGSLGDVMKESAHAAVTYIRTVTDKLNIENEFYKNKDIHLHFPDGATPKDGPSAGIAITTCLISALTQAPTNHSIAMTGEVTIRGKVLPIGGLKEKSMAAASHGMKKVLIPADNVPDLADVDEEVKKSVEFVPVSTMDEVIKIMFSKDDIKAKKRQRAGKKNSNIART